MHTQNKREFINNITIKLTAYEEERKKRIRKLIISELKAFAIICGGCFGVEFFLSREAGIPLVLCACVVFFATVFFFLNIYDSNKDFKKFLKEKCQKDILKVFNLETMDGVSFSREKLMKSNLFSTFNRQEDDDVIQGKYNDVEYTIAETKLKQENRKSEFTVFKGVIISFKSNKEIDADTLITTKGDNNIRNYPTGGKFFIYWMLGAILVPIVVFAPFTLRFSGMIINSGMDTTPLILRLIFGEMSSFILPGVLILFVLYLFYEQKKKMQDVKLEAVSFDKRFNVYTEDQIEARYLITPSFMERLQNLKTVFGTRNIKCSFFDNQIMFAIPTNRDLFELGSLYKSLNSNKYIENFYNELSSIQQMVNHFKLTEKTGL